MKLFLIIALCVYFIIGLCSAAFLSSKTGIGRWKVIISFLWPMFFIFWLKDEYYYWRLSKVLKKMGNNK